MKCLSATYSMMWIAILTFVFVEVLGYRDECMPCTVIIIDLWIPWNAYICIHTCILWPIYTAVVKHPPS